MTTVTIISGGVTGNSYVDGDGVRWCEWIFRVEVDGNVGINGEWVSDDYAQANFGTNANDPSIAPSIQQDIVDWLQADPSAEGGVSQLDGTSPDGRDGSDGEDGRDGPDGPDGDDGGGDGVLAGGGNLGDSV